MGITERDRAANEYPANANLLRERAPVARGKAARRYDAGVAHAHTQIDRRAPPPPPIRAQGAASPALRPPDLSPGTPESGDVIGGRYRVLHTIAEGGMGAVYEVAHIKLGKSFALKQIRGEQDETARQDFYREAHYASAISHPAFPAVVDFGEDADFGMFMVSEYVEGLSLATMIGERGALSSAAACALLAEIAEALQHLHDLQLAHGDIKGENILIAAEAGGRRRRQAKIIDLGLARSRARTGGVLAGTPQYLAPEMLDGSYAGPQTDIYALGVLTYLVITGRLPYVGSATDLMLLHAGADTPLPSRAGASPLFDPIVARAMAAKPEQRFQTVGEYLECIQDIMGKLGMQLRRAPLESGEPLRDFQVCDLPITMAIVAPDSEVLSATESFADLIAAMVPTATGCRLSESPLGVHWPDLLEDLALAAEGRAIRRVIAISRAGRDRQFSVTVEPALQPEAISVLAYPLFEVGRGLLSE